MNGCGSEREKSSLSVLVVDDNEINRFFIFHALRKMGHEPSMAGDGRQAIDVFSEQAFDLVLMDVQLPDMDGLQLTRLIREGQAGTVNPADVPIVALTAFASRDDRKRCLEAGMDAHLAKPVNVADIQAAITKVLRSHREAASPAAVTAPAGFDLAALTRESAPEFVAEMLGLFLDLAEPKQEALAQAVAQGDLDVAGPLAHDLAGMAGPIRALRLHQSMKAVQEACKSGQVAVCREYHATADRELDAVLTALRAHPYLADKTS